MFMSLYILKSYFNIDHPACSGFFTEHRVKEEKSVGHVLRQTNRLFIKHAKRHCVERHQSRVTVT